MDYVFRVFYGKWYSIRLFLFVIINKIIIIKIKSFCFDFFLGFFVGIEVCKVVEVYM